MLEWQKISLGGLVNFKRVFSVFLSFFLLIAPGCYAGDSIAVPAMSQWSEGWYQDASGYDQAVAEYKETNKPMVVYMSVGWCPYCRKFEKEVLSSPLVQEMLEDKIKVVINPESGRRENALALQYGIEGFPSFFLHPPQPARAVQLYTGVAPGKFVEYFKEVLA